MYEPFKSTVLSIFLGMTLIAGPQLLAQNTPMQDINPRMQPKLDIDEERVKANGIRKLPGQHIDLYTDLRDRSDVDELVIVFDLAVKEWCDYFNVEIQKTASYRLSGFVIEDRARFRRAGLMPDDLPDFLAGFNRGHEMWVYLQPGKYYSRHLLLHEGTHAFMQWFLGGSGPHWYSEGMAEKLAIHEWKDGRLKLNFRATDRNQVEYWGRPKIIREARTANRLKSIDDVFDIPSHEYRQVESYAWSWALCEFMSQHPATCDDFKTLTKKCKDSTAQFTVEFARTINSNRAAVDRDWQIFLGEHDYGIEAKHMVIQEADAEAGKNNFLIHADQGWQRTNINVDKGDLLKIQAGGRFQIAHVNRAWQSEAGGVTIEYYRGWPIGMLLAGVLNENNVQGLLEPIAVGLKSEIEMTRDGELCFRINDSPARMDDNEGCLQVSVEASK